VPHNIDNILNTFVSINLSEMDTVKLLDRYDTKYIFHKELLVPILTSLLGNYRILEINNRRLFNYQTQYLDTEKYSTYLAHHNGKLNRYKIRIREYLNSDERFIEVKLKTNKSKTYKRRTLLTKTIDESHIEIMNFLNANIAGGIAEVHNTLVSRFNRMTFVDNSLKMRVTFDTDIEFESDQKKIRIPHLVIAEIKQPQCDRNIDIIKKLRELNVVKTRFSKYCTGLALLNENIKYNRFKSKLITIKKICNDPLPAKFITGC